MFGWVSSAAKFLGLIPIKADHISFRGTLNVKKLHK